MELCQAMAMQTFGTVTRLALRQNDPGEVLLFYLHSIPVTDKKTANKSMK